MALEAMLQLLRILLVIMHETSRKIHKPCIPVSCFTLTPYLWTSEHGLQDPTHSQSTPRALCYILLCVWWWQLRYHISLYKSPPQINASLVYRPGKSLVLSLINIRATIKHQIELRAWHLTHVDCLISPPAL